MMRKPHIAIACGGTGGHLFPGLAVAEALTRRGVDVSLLISPKQVDQEAVKAAVGLEVVTLPAVGLSGGRLFRFLWSFWRSYLASRRFFRRRPPEAVLAMGGFTSAAPVLAGRACGAATFLHESNTIPGRANRLLSRVVDQAFVGFPETASRLSNRNVATTGTPVRAGFRNVERSEACRALGLDLDHPVLVVTGGSQGAVALNDLILEAAPQLIRELPGLQLVHLTGLAEEERVREAYAGMNIRATVRAFLHEMPQALGAATVLVSRSGASSLAETAAVRVPPILIPYPAAVGNHQHHNAAAFGDSGAALFLEEKSATAATLVTMVVRLVEDRTVHRSMQEALRRWDSPRAAELIAEKMLDLVAERKGSRDEPRVAPPEEGPGIGKSRSVTV